MYAAIVVALLVAPSLGARLPYIIGGKDVANPGDYPWQGSLQFLGSHSCGCSLVSDRFIITAGHCILLPMLQSVILGAHDIMTQKQGEPTKYAIEKAVVNPDFDMNGDGFPNDVALIKLKKAADMTSKYVGAIALAPAAAGNDDLSDCFITGWGAVKMIVGIIPKLPNILQEADVGLYSKSECQNMFTGVGGATINDGHVCCGTDDQGACSGDSGGPLVCTYNDGRVLVGLTSWGVSTCNTKYPSVYTRVSYFRDWIDKTMTTM